MPKTRAERMFQDVWNPTREEILHWAYTRNTYLPTQDFELALDTIELRDIILNCASDDKCPHRHFFLSCLYVTVGDAVRTEWKRYSHKDILQLIALGEKAQNADVRKWAERAQHVIAEPTTYNYEQWGLGSSFVYEARQNNTKQKRNRGRNKG